MSSLELESVSVRLGERARVDGVSLKLEAGDFLALVGPNGAGKTTLLRILLGEYTPEAGTRVLARGTRIGYLPQEAAEKFDGSVLDRALDAHRAVLDMRAELDALHQDLAGIAPEDPRLESLLERAGELQHHLEMHDEHALEVVQLGTRVAARELALHDDQLAARIAALDQVIGEHETRAIVVGRGDHRSHQRVELAHRRQCEGSETLAGTTRSTSVGGRGGNRANIAPHCGVSSNTCCSSAPQASA